MTEDQCFAIQVVGEVTKFTNNTPYTVWVSVKPVPPKRKIIHQRVVKSGDFVFFDNPDFKVDLTRLYISFTEP